jgi:hypothetical protein
MSHASLYAIALHHRRMNARVVSTAKQAVARQNA